MTISKNFVLKRIVPVLAGAVLGFAYYYFIGCRTGTCPITGNPYVSTLYGAFAGLILTFPSHKKEVSDDRNNQDD